MGVVSGGERGDKPKEVTTRPLRRHNLLHGLGILRHPKASPLQVGCDESLLQGSEAGVFSFYASKSLVSDQAHLSILATMLVAIVQCLAETVEVAFSQLPLSIQGNQSFFETVKT